jgi:hypothetical protein
MSKYIIKYNKKHEIETKSPISCVDKTGISYCLSDGCELTERIGNSDIYLGVINYKTMIYFSIEFTKFGMKNCSNNHENQKYYNEILDMLSEWASGEQKGVVPSFPHPQYPYMNSAERYIWRSLYFSCKLTGYLEKNDFENAFCYRSAIDGSIHAYRNITGEMLSKTESERQGDYIIDFLKSGKNLFLL